MSDHAFIEARQERYRVAHNALDSEALLALFADDLEYTDHNAGAVGVNKEAVTHVVDMIFSSMKDLEFKSVSLNGTREFTAWEWTSSGILTKEIPGLPLKVGDKVGMMGCSLFWWVGEGDDPKTWKIKKEVEYKKVV